METRYKEEIFHDKSGKILQQVAQRRGKCPIPVNIQDQLRQSSEQHDKVEDAPAHLRGIGPR